MLYNTIMIFLVLLAVAGVLFIYFRRTTLPELGEEYDNPYTVDYLVEYVNRAFSLTKRRSLKDMNLSKTDYEREAKKKKELREAEKEAAFGDVQAKRYIKALILSIISDARREHPVTRDTIDQVIPFNAPNDMTVRDKFETLLYVYENSTNAKEKSGRKYGSDALRVMIEEPRIRRLSRSAILMANERPSLDILRKPNCQITSPGVRNRLKHTVITRRKRIVFMPRTI